MQRRKDSVYCLPQELPLMHEDKELLQAALPLGHSARANTVISSRSW